MQREDSSTVYAYDVIALTGRAVPGGAPTGFQDGVSINDNGVVAFITEFGSVEDLLIGDTEPIGISGEAVRNLSLGFSGSFSRAVQINNDNEVIAQNPGSASAVRVWLGLLPVPAFTTIATGSFPADFFDFENTFAFPSINNNRQVVFEADPPDNLLNPLVLVTTGFQAGGSVEPFNEQFLLTTSIRPLIADTGQVLVRDPSSQIILYDFSLNLGSIQGIAIAGTGANADFNSVGRAPGISDNAKAITFFGDLQEDGATALGLTPGPGIFASIEIASGRQLFRLAGVAGDGVIDPGETFTDTNGNGIFDPEEPFTDTNGNGVYDLAEPFTDTNGNGIFDPEESFVDINENGIFDPGETFVDANSNGIFDPGEPFVDANGNGVFDPGETFIDDNGNGLLDPGEFFIDDNGNGIFDPAETFTDTNDNGVFDPAETFVDDNNNGIFDPAEPFIDANGNGEFDLAEPFTDTNDNGTFDPAEPFTDANGNGAYDSEVDEGLISSFVEDERVGVSYFEGSNQGLGTATYLAFDAAGNETLLTSQFTVDLETSTLVTSSPTVVAQVGELASQISPDLTGNIADIGIYDPINSDGQVAFLAQTTTSQEAIIRANPLLRPVLIIPGIGASLPEDGDFRDWLTNRGVDPESLQIETGGIDVLNIIETLQRAGYVEGTNLFVAPWDWRLPAGPDASDGEVVDGRINRSVEDLTDDRYEYAVDQLAFWLQEAIKGWRSQFDGLPEAQIPDLDSVDIITHSAGGLLPRVYLQSDAYGQEFSFQDDDGTTINTNLPEINNLINIAFPNAGASIAWNPLLGDFNTGAVVRILGTVADLAFRKVRVGDVPAISFNGDPTALEAITTEEAETLGRVGFINEYAGSLSALLATYPFIDELPLEEEFETAAQVSADFPNGPFLDNSLLADLNGAPNPTSFADDLGQLTVIYGTNEPTRDSVAETEPDVYTALEGGVAEDSTRQGDNTVSLFSAAGLYELFPNPRIDLRPFTNGENTADGVNHSQLPSNTDVQELILDTLGVQLERDQIVTSLRIPNIGSLGSEVLGVTTTFLGLDPVEGFLVDSLGRRVGYSRATGPLTEIPGSFWLGDEDGLGGFSSAVEGPIQLQLIGLGEEYFATVSLVDADGTPGRLEVEGFLAEGEEVFFDIPTNSAPTLDLNGSGNGNDFGTSFTTADTISIVDSGLLVTDVDSSALQGATITLTNPQDGTSEVLSATPVGNVAVDYDDATSTLTLSGAALVSTYEQILRTVTYTNTATAPNTTERQITFVVDDGAAFNNFSSVATTTLSFNLPNNNAPEATDDNYSTNEDTELVVDITDSVLVNDSDIDGDNLTVIGNTDPNNGLVTVNPDGTFTYTPDSDFNGSDSFTYTVSDGNNGTATATVNLTINAVNDVPIVVDDSFTTDEDTELIVDITDNVLVNDSDIDDDNLTVIGNTDPNNGLVTVNPDGTFTYTPDSDFNGSDSFTYTVSDGNNGTATATVNLTINAVNDAPIAVDDSFTTDEDTELIVDITDNVLVNDSDIDDDNLTVIGNTDPNNGLVTVNPDGTFTYTPDSDFNGSDSFTYTVSDGNNGTATATVNLTINAVNDAPIAIDDSLTTDEDTSISGNIFADNGNGVDSDPDGDTFTVTEINGNAADVGEQITLASGALLTLNLDGSYSYNPNGQFESLNDGQTETDSFTYTIDDGNGETSGATVSINITGVNDVPDDLNVINGDNGPNFLQGTPDNDEINGLGGRDLLVGQSGNDQLFGGNGVDILWGRSGNDLLDGGKQTDYLIGGAGQDQFALQAGSGRDFIFDYHDGVDSFVLLGDLAFEDLTIQSLFGGTGIREGHDLLGILFGVNPNEIDASDFVANFQP